MPAKWYTSGMPEISPHCLNPVHSTVSRVPMMRAYVRLSIDQDSRRAYVPIGWFCRFCSQLVADK